MAETDGVFYWRREAPAEWHEAIGRLAPRTDRASHLALFWDSGTPSQPIQRWGVYECTPLAFVPPWKLGAFLADHPCTCARESVELGTCRHCGGFQSPGRAQILDYLHRTECLALPFWVVQGDTGGHKYRYTTVEENWMRLAGRPQEPPRPGSLPYAEIDNRVLRQIRRFDRTRRAWGDLAKAYHEEQNEARLAFGSALADYLDEGVDRALDMVPIRARSAIVDEVPRSFTSDRKTMDYDEAREGFISRTQ